jgi:uncharacterized low-complexity protein
MMGASTTKQGEATMFTHTKIALATALILGAASAARANDSGENHQDENRSAVSSSVARVNAGGAYGYAAAPIHKQRPVHKQTQSR